MRRLFVLICVSGIPIPSNVGVMGKSQLRRSQGTSHFNN